MDTLIQEVLKFLPPGQAVALGLLVWLVYRVNTINGAIIELKTWRDLHDRMDTERFKQIEDYINRHGNG